MAQISNLIHQTSEFTGVGPITGLQTVYGRRAFSSVWQDTGTDVFYYFISHRTADEWEVGIGSLNASGGIDRDTILDSANGGGAVNFSEGTKDVTNALPDSKQVDTGSIPAAYNFDNDTGTLVIGSKVLQWPSGAKQKDVVADTGATDTGGSKVPTLSNMITRFAAVGGVAGIKSVQVFTDTGTALYTRPAGVTKAIVICAGGGGGGGGTTSSALPASGGGGGGGVGIKFISDLAATATAHVGGGGVAGNNAFGDTGQTTRFHDTGAGGTTLIIAEGGRGGENANGSSFGGLGGRGGPVTGADLNLVGSDGGNITHNASGTCHGALGGSGLFGAGAGRGGTSSGNGDAGGTNTGGGGGGSGSSAGSEDGGSGGSGVVWVLEFGG